MISGSSWTKRACSGLATLALTGALATACGSDADEAEANTLDQTGEPPSDNAYGPPAARVVLVFAHDVSPVLRARYASLLTESLGKPVEVVDVIPEPLDATSLVVSIGDTPVTRALIPVSERSALEPEAFIVRSGKHGSATVLAADGAPAKSHPHGNLGAYHGAYALLEELGFAFLHPLAPVVPKPLRLPTAPIDQKAAPRWDTREIHLHTQHPLELTELLQGFGEEGPEDARGFERMLPEWDRFLEWSVANGQNGVEWFLLWAKSFESFADSDLRIDRLRQLVDRAHAFGISAGIDAPIAFAQQHSFRLLRQQGELENELGEIRMRLDWLARAGWDFYGIESGTSEFTAPAPDRMLAWMNEVARHLDENHGGKRAFIKVHCSAGQVAEGYADPVTGKPINFNMLPHHADKRLGILPHTVQHYGLTDPAPTYGNTSFGYIRDFLWQEVGRRPVVYYPETAYWVSFDIDVPLFLPLYADRRLADLQPRGCRAGRRASHRYREDLRRPPLLGRAARVPRRAERAADPSARRSSQSSSSRTPLLRRYRSEPRQDLARLRGVQTEERAEEPRVRREVDRLGDDRVRVDSALRADDERHGPVVEPWTSVARAFSGHDVALEEGAEPRDHVIVACTGIRRPRTAHEGEHVIARERTLGDPARFGEDLGAPLLEHAHVEDFGDRSLTAIEHAPDRAVEQRAPRGIERECLRGEKDVRIGHAEDPRALAEDLRRFGSELGLDGIGLDP